jgi:hypothetical protein
MFINPARLPAGWDQSANDLTAVALANSKNPIQVFIMLYTCTFLLAELAVGVDPAEWVGWVSVHSFARSDPYNSICKSWNEASFKRFRFETDRFVREADLAVLAMW